MGAACEGEADQEIVAEFSEDTAVRLPGTSGAAIGMERKKNKINNHQKLIQQTNNRNPGDEKHTMMLMYKQCAIIYI
jgi:hypothetical protein